MAGVKREFLLSHSIIELEGNLSWKGSLRIFCSKLLLMAPASINEQALENLHAVNYGEKVCVESCTLDMGDSTHRELLLWPFCLQSILFLISLLFQNFQSPAWLQQMEEGRQC